MDHSCVSTIGAETYTVRIIPPEGGAESLAGLNEAEDAITHHLKVCRLGDVLAPFVRGQEVYAPSPQHQSGKVVYGYQLSHRIALAHGITLLRNEAAFADGVLLKPGEHFLVSTTGAVVVASGHGFVMAASATRDSLIDYGRLMGGPGRGSESIITSMRNLLNGSSSTPSNLSVRMFFSYEPEQFGHPIIGKSNEKNCRLVEEIRTQAPAAVHMHKAGAALVDLEELVASQCRRVGFTFIPGGPRLRADGPHAHSRHVLVKKRTERNLVLVSAH